MTQAPEPPIQAPDPPPAAYTAPLPPVRHARLYQAAAWVVIVAGTVFVLAVVFIAGAELSGRGPTPRPHHHGVFAPDAPMGPDGGPPWVVFPGGPFPPGTGPGGPPWMGPWGPGMGPGGPGGRGGPGGHGGGHEGPQEPPPPTYTP
jgi:hypothetical protein